MQLRLNYISTLTNFSMTQHMRMSIGLRRSFKLFSVVYSSKAPIHILSGFHYPEHWAMLVAGLVSGKKIGVFCDSTIRDRPQRKVAGMLKRFFFSRCSGFFVYGTRASEYVQHYGATADKIYTRCQAAFLPPEYSKVDVLSHRGRTNAGAEMSILYVGRLSPEKSIHLLIKAMVGVIQVLPGAKLRIVGDGPEKFALQRAATDTGVGAIHSVRGFKNPVRTSSILHAGRIALSFQAKANRGGLW